jgi:hypothetical protein
MALQSSGLITLAQVQAEFGGSNPISMSEYYRGGAYTTTNNTGVPTSGSISLSNFYNTVKSFSFTISSNTQEANLSTLATAAGWDGSVPLFATIASGVYVWSDNTAIPGLIINVPNCTVTNNGYIIGRGGNGANAGGNGQAGGPAINVTTSGVAITNASGAYIAGGGGGNSIQDSVDSDRVGGGGGAGGGRSGSGYTDGGYAGGAIGQVGNTGIGFQGGTASTPGHHQGFGQSITSQDGGSGSGYHGCSAGRNPGGAIAGTQGTGGNIKGGNGGFWGQAGVANTGRSATAAGAGGAAITGTSPSLTNNGTIYGSTV